MRRSFAFALLATLSIPGTSAQAQGVNYIQAQQAGKVWGDKISENNRKAAAQGRGMDQRAPTPAELNAARALHRSDYDRLVNSVGTKNADKWLDWRARADRRDRKPGAKLASAAQRKPTPAPSGSCSTAAWSPGERRRLEAEFALRMRRDGRESAGAWAHEQGRLLREKLTADGSC